MCAANRLYTVQILLLAFAAGCNNVLDVHPINEVDESQAITTPAGARAAVAGLYDALQGGSTDPGATQNISYYGGELLFFGDLSSDKIGAGDTLTAASDTLTGATSAALDVTPGAATEPGVSVEPTTATAGVAGNPAVGVTARDALGDT